MALRKPSSSEGLERVCTHPGRHAGSWLASLKSLFRELEIGPQARHAFEAWVALEARRGRSLDWTPHQMAAGICDPTTIRRALPRLLEAGICRMVSPADHSQKKAGVFRFNRMVPAQFSINQNAKCPSPGTCSNQRTQSTSAVHLNHTSHITPEPVCSEGAHGGAKPWSLEGQKAVLEVIQTLGVVNSSGWNQVITTSPLDESRALQVAQTAVQVAPFQAHSNPIGWALKALRTQTFAENLLRTCNTPAGKIASGDGLTGVPTHTALETASEAELHGSENPTVENPSPWGEETPHVRAALLELPADPAGAVVAERKTWCDGTTALRVLEACRKVWHREGPPLNPGGFACAALRVRGLGESILAQIPESTGTLTRLGYALKIFREEERARRQDRAHAIDRDHPYLHVAELAEAIREICEPKALAASEQAWVESWGLTNLNQGPHSLAWRAWIAAGLTTGLVAGWDLEALLGDGLTKPERREAA